MKTGFGRQSGYHRVTTGLALTAVVALPLLLSGCEDHSPVAAPSSTLPAQDPSTDSPDADPQPTVPAYETDLDLSPEETEAVEGALLAFDGYFRSVNAAYSGNFESTTDFPKFASGEALKSIKGDAQVVQDGTYEFTGTITPTKVAVDEVNAPHKSQDAGTVSIEFCFDLRKWSLHPKDGQEGKAESNFVTMEHTITKTSDGWKVSEQSLKEKRC